MASTFIEGLLVRHTSKFKGLPRGRLGEQMLGRLRDYIVAHLDEHIEAGALAKIAGRSPFHFTRVFARSVGMTPYRYVVHLRLQRALELMGNGRHGLADIAAATGFADQSHLSRWVRRVHGVSPSKFTAQWEKQQESSRSVALVSLRSGQVLRNTMRETKMTTNVQLARQGTDTLFNRLKSFCSAAPSSSHQHG